MFALVLTVLLHTSKRMHFIEELLPLLRRGMQLPLHTSKRMHFIEDSLGDA